MRADDERLKVVYLQHLQLRNLSPLSIKQVEQGLRVFGAYLDEAGVSSIRRLERSHIEGFKEHLSRHVSAQGKALASATIRDRFFQVQRWLAFLRKRGLIARDPAADIRAPRRVRRLPGGVLSQEEIQRVMDVPKLESLTGYRDRTIMEVLYATGARSKEVAGMRAPDVNLKAKVVRIRNGKGGKERFVPLTTSACRFIERYLRVVRPELAVCMRPAGRMWLEASKVGGDLLFLSLYGGPLRGNWLTTMIKRYMFLARIEKKVSPVHGFRHSVATHLIADGMDVRYVQALLGHDNINSTQIYTHIERDTLKRQMANHHPIELSRRRLVAFKEAAHAAHR